MPHIAGHLPVTATPLTPGGFGLAGGEEALLAGATSGAQTLGEASLQTGQTFDRAFGLLGEGQRLLGERTDLAARGLEEVFQRGNVLFDEAGNIIQDTTGQVGDVFGQGVQGLQGFAQPGIQANQQQAALSGALGPEAQAAAFQQFQASPGQQFLQQQGERALLRNQAALGGLGGGNVRQELVRFGQGLAAQDFQNQFNRLGEVSGRGLSGATTQAGLRGQQAGIQAQLGAEGARLLPQQAGFQRGIGQTFADITQRQGALEAGLAQQGANLLGTQAGIQSGLGQQQADIFAGTGRDVGAQRFTAGRDVAQAIGGTTSALASLAERQGAGGADILGAGTQNINQLLQLASQGDANAKEKLATILANLGTGSASQVANLPIIQGVQTNTLGNLGQLASGVGGLLESLPSQQPAPITRAVPAQIAA